MQETGCLRLGLNGVFAVCALGLVNLNHVQTVGHTSKPMRKYKKC